MQTQMSAILPDFNGFVISHGAFHLRLLDQLGRGAYGVVHLAEDISRERRGSQYYAVKAVLRHPVDSDLERQHRREIVNHARVSDIPNVVKLHAVIEEDFYVFIVLDLCTGGDLFSAIMETDAYVHNDRAVKRTMLQIIDALEACHAKGVYHRDLKPENILCSLDHSQVFIGDFGLSTRARLSHNFGCGSSFYMSPECLGIYRKKKPYLTGPSDVWSLGTILCNLITGRNPWHVASPKGDDGFRLYLREGPAWLLHNLPISLGAAAILGRIFDLDPDTRITLPELRDAVLALDTFYPSAAPSTSPNARASDVKEDAPVQAAVSVRSSKAPSTNISNVIVSSSSSIHDDLTDIQLRPIPLASKFSTDFMSVSPEALSMAASATLAGAISTFTNEQYVSQVGEDFEDAWSVSGPPPLASSPENTSDGEESDGPITPETRAVDGASARSIPELALESRSSSSSGHAFDGLSSDDTAHAVSRLAALRLGNVDKKRRGSMSRFVDGMKKIRILV